LGGWGGPDYAEAMKWYMKAALAGDQDAMNSIGILYHHGRGVKRNMVEAINWFRRAADAGGAEAMENLGGLYCDGGGGDVEVNYPEGLSWLHKADDAGNTAALRKLAQLYEQGKGVSEDLAEAKWWYRRAAEKGDEKSAEWLKKH